jgi:SAM-dependent methyltransferase
MTEPEYYSHTRSEILPLLPAAARCIVDVGCGAGSTLRWLRTVYPGAHMIGLEGHAAMRSAIGTNADEAHIVDLNGELPRFGQPDLMLFLDVLEHVTDPVAVLGRLTAQLVPGGTIIVSVPNVAHLSVALPLLLSGSFEYRDAGILDRTHLRFFVQRSAIALLHDAGFAVDRGLMTGFGGPRTRLLDRVTFGAMRRRLAKQYILRGTRAISTAARATIRWDVT